jgi:hypothetical protein
LRWEEHAAHMGGREMNTILVGKPEGMIPLGRID